MRDNIEELISKLDGSDSEREIVDRLKRILAKDLERNGLEKAEAHPLGAVSIFTGRCSPEV
ncbi:hypothetical protein [Acanthopleuribacter pedis]|uniref:Uncharacterized protein n=1 Tax=Acanthopleuribacter pedis TaxID=442870 RepID=A0A8J7PY50_9BACT|nr:hypothetical protein [Acanthopleuribacter pedis]MBO1316822.1 hypothetical protein [Acanthopleuribacter pedis]